jgi:hypothetical protein
MLQRKPEHTGKLVFLSINKPRALCTSLALCTSMALFGHSVSAQNNRTDRIQREQIEEYCIGCHNFEDYAGSLEMETILNDPLSAHAEEWEKAIRKLRAGMMPPPGQDRPDTDDYLALTQWLEDRIDEAAPLNPGTKTLHRLNQSEYANAIEELLGIRIDPSLYLPADSSARGFDNQAGSLTISPTLLEAYTRAASRIARMAVGTWNSPTEMTYIVDADNSQNVQLDGMPFNTRGGIAVEHNFPADGEYAFSMQNFGLGSYIPGEKLEISIDGERMHLFDYTGLGIFVGMGGDHDGSLDVTLPVKAGTHLVGATFVATNFRPDIGLIQEYDRKSIENNDLPQVQYHPAIGMLKISGPFNAEMSVDSPSREKIFICSPANADEEAECAERILLSLTRKAFRRPVTETDIAPMMTFYNEGRSGGSFDDGIELAVRRLLADPEFLVRREQEPANIADGEAYAITDLELASRMSFFLWSNVPDDELIELAAANRLSEPAVLEAQVRRMLDDPKADAMVQNFGQQWLYLRNLPTTSPDGIFFPDWDAELRHAFQQETELLFESIIREDRPITTLLDADYTFVNERLAKHYGIPNIYGAHFRRVNLGPELDYRRGILGQGSFLALTWAENFRTSPVKRGVWVLENLLGTPPPAPPANVPALEETGENRITNLREQLTMHRQNEPCATCHAIMDGIGFALENFNADGKYRTMAGHPRQFGGQSSPIDATVELWDGTTVTGPSGLRNQLLKYSPQFVRFSVEKLMTYGVGRGTEYYDMPQVRKIVKDAEADDYRFSSLVLGVVNSPQFRMRMKTANNDLAGN